MLVDDHQILRDGIRTLLEKQGEMVVMAEADNGTEAVAMAEEVRPDIVIMDLMMPGMNGIAATRRILDRCPKTKVLALSMNTGKRFIIEALNAGASGYLLKECAYRELENAIHAVLDGNSYLSAKIRGIGIEEKLHESESHLVKDGELAPREREVLKLLASGECMKGIASHLGLSVKTVETYRSRVMDKLSIYSVAGLTTYAITNGITTLDE